MSRNTARISFRLALIAAFIAVALMAVGLVGFLSYRNGKRAVHHVALQLRGDISARILENLENFLRLPHRINQVNGQSIQAGHPPADDPSALEARFRNQIALFPQISSIYFANAHGGIINSGREPSDDSRYMISTDEFRAGIFRKYAVDPQGQQTRLLVSAPNFDARERPWYVNAVEAGGPAWTDIYILFTGQDMAIAASRPVHSRTGDLLGVCSVDMFLGHVNAFLRDLLIGVSGQAFILDQTGHVVAASTLEKSFIPANGETAARRMHAANSTDMVLQQAHEALTAHFSRLDAIQRQENIDFILGREKYFLQVTPLHDPAGIDWLVAVVLPETDIMGRINVNNRMTLLLMLAALILAMAVGWYLARRITGPIQALNAAADKLARGSDSRPILDVSRFSEIQGLTDSFNHMAGQLSASLAGLRAEVEERKRSEAALRESEERFSKAFKSSPAPLAISDITTGELIDMNDCWLEMLGYEKAEQVGKTSRELGLWADPSERDRIVAMLRQKGSFKEESIIFKTKDGRELHTLWSAEAISLGGREVMLSMVHDQTERLQAEKERNALQTQLLQAQKMESVGILAGGIAHDFNNLLQAISGNIQLLGRNKPDDHPDSGRLQTIANSIRRASQLVRQLLLFSRKADVQPRLVNMNQAVQEAVELLRRTIPRMITIDLQLDPQPWPVNADPLQIEQVLLNLGTNAVDAMPQGGRLRMETRNLMVDAQFAHTYLGTDPGPYVLLHVSDNGVGMDADTLAHVFEPFFSTKEVGKGTGLGLASVYGILKSHGGHILCSSQPGQGASFKMYWPAMPGQRIAMPGPELQHQSAAGGSETILVVDDETDIRELTMEALQACGYRVMTAADGEQALEVYAQHVQGIDLVILDLGMPGMGGHQCLRELRRMNPQARILIASGYSAAGQARVTQGQGAAGFIAKPYQLADLLGTVRDILETSQPKSHEPDARTKREPGSDQ